MPSSSWSKSGFLGLNLRALLLDGEIRVAFPLIVVLAVWLALIGLMTDAVHGNGGFRACIGGPGRDLSVLEASGMYRVRPISVIVIEACLAAASSRVIVDIAKLDA